MSGADLVGWAATALFAASYFCREPRRLRLTQAAAALLWLGYGVALRALPRRVVLEHHPRRVERDDRVEILRVPGLVVSLYGALEFSGGVGLAHDSSMSSPKSRWDRVGPRPQASPTRRIGQLLPPPARNCSQASLIRSAWPCVNMFMQESCE